MLLDYLEHTNQLHNASIDEKIDSLNLTIKPSVSILLFFPKFFDELKTLSKRDNFELFVEIEGTHKKITNCSNSSYEEIQNHITDFDSDAEYEIELRVKKQLHDKTISVYFIESFSRYLNDIPVLNVINLISNYFDNSLNLEVFSKIKCFGTSSIKFIEAHTQHDSSIIDDQYLSLERDKKLSLLFDNATTSNFTLELIPDDFYLIENSTLEILNDIFTKISSLLSLIFIANSSSFEKDGTFLYKISGYKSISEKISLFSHDKDMCSILYKIYDWSYEGGNCSDKIGLVRNVLSIHLDDNNKIKIDNEAWQAIQSNYQIYLKENIQSYLEIKNKIGEFVIESSSRTYTMANEILSSFKNSIFVFITFLLTVVVVNGLKDTGERGIFSDAYFAIVIILCVASLIWREMTRKAVLKQFESASSTVKEILQLNYNKVLMQGEINQCIDPVVSTNRRYLENQVEQYSKWWLIIILTFGLIYGMANIYFEHPDIFKFEEKNITRPVHKENLENPQLKEKTK